VSFTIILKFGRKYPPGINLTLLLIGQLKNLSFRLGQNFRLVFISVRQI